MSITPLRRWLPVMALFTFSFAFSLGLAQTSAPPPEGPQVANKTLLDLWVQGGFFMYPIALLSIGAVAFTIYGFLNTSENRMIHMELVPALKDALSKADLSAAVSLCTGTPCPMTNILHAGLRRIADTYDKTSVEKAMEEAAVEENTVGLRSINYLSIIATLAPMFGLLGTVSGMIKAFQKIGLGGMGDPEKLANDIGEAMITTAFGLLVGIPAMFFYFYLKSQFVGNMARIGRIMGDLTHDLDRALNAQAAGAPVSPASPSAPLPPTAP